MTRTFDAANRLVTSGDGGGVTSYTYDPNGNLTTIDPPGASGTVRYGYDQRNLLITSTVDGSAVASFFYDGMNNRLRQVDYTGALPITTTYTNDILGLTQVLIADDGADQVISLFGLDLILQDDGIQDLVSLADGLGSVRTEMVVDSVDAVTTYSPYGTILDQEGDSATVYGFTGEQEDGATGLLYLRARYYNSTLNRFLSADPIIPNPTDPQTLNLYAYVSGNPANNVDPSGLCEQYFPDEACWSIYEQIVRRFPDAINRLYWFNFDYRHLHELPSSRLLVVLRDEVAFASAAEGAFGDCNVGQCPRHLAPGAGDFRIPDTGAVPGNRVFSQDTRDALNWGVAHARAIESASLQYGVPPELVAGLIVAEIDLDYVTPTSGWPDALARNAYANQHTGWGACLVNLLTDPTTRLGDLAGGYANVHHNTYVIVEEYHANQYSNPLAQGTTRRDYLPALLTNQGAIDFVARMSRFLADQRTGRTGSHLVDLNLTDMAQMWAAYRNGIYGVTCFRGPSLCGFKDLEEFQVKPDLGPQAQLGLSFFEYFQRYFEDN